MGRDEGSVGGFGSTGHDIETQVSFEETNRGRCGHGRAWNLEAAAMGPVMGVDGQPTLALELRCGLQCFHLVVAKKAQVPLSGFATEPDAVEHRGGLPCTSPDVFK